MTLAERKAYLNAKAEFYENPEFLETDPLQVPHRFSIKEDIEISAFFTATLAWGNRKTIINSALRLLELLDNAPYDFICNHTNGDLKSLSTFVHRTFNGDDLIFFVKALNHCYKKYGGLEGIFTQYQEKSSLQPAITKLKEHFFELPHLPRTKKHVSNPATGSAAKRINMFLRWMVRSNTKGVDFGIWKGVSPALLSCPLDVHSGAIARRLKLIKRSQNDAKALLELDGQLRKMDGHDPVKYDFALFGIGVFEKK